MCTGNMRLDERETTITVPGRAAPLVRQVREWVCPECDFFEEAEVIEE